MSQTAWMNKIELSPTREGKLDNFKFAVKDVIDVRGTKTSCGNPYWLEQQLTNEVNAICVDQLLGEGAKCVGKTVLGEFCSGSTGINHFYGMPINPNFVSRVPGGSSSGSASVVANGSVDFSLGTDAAGSIRVPASFCGLFGMRPSLGKISMSGIKSFAPSFDTVGIFSKTIEIIELVFNCLVGDLIEIESKNAKEFFVFEDLILLGNQRHQAIYYEFIENICKKLKLSPIFLKLNDLHIDINDQEIGLSSIFKKILCAEIWTTIGSWIRNKGIEFKKQTYVDFIYISSIDRSTLNDVFKMRELYSTKLNELLSNNGLICIPTVPDVPPLRKIKYDKVNEFDYEKLRPLVALSGIGRLPQINIPLQSKENLPLGVSLLSAYGQDKFLIETIDLSPRTKTMTLMRFPINYNQWRSQNEKTLYRRTNYQSNQIP